MSELINSGFWRKWWVIVILVLASIGALKWIAPALWGDPEIALIYGEPWEDMRQRSSAIIDPAIADTFWFAMPESDARLRFIDPQYGFATPLARFFTISFDNERVSNIRLSPQVEPLLLDDALKIVLDLQGQWRKQGWVVSNTKSDPAIVDSPDWRIRLRDINTGARTFWRAGNKYQIMLHMNRFNDIKHPDEERYLISIAISKPWIPGDDELPSKHSELILGEPPQ